MPKPSELLSFWFAALNEPLGLYLTTPDPIALKAALYSARINSPDREAIKHLQIRTSPGNPRGELWLVNPQREEEG